MQNVLRRRPSPSMVVAIAALLLAASGTALATTTLVNGDKLIAKRSLSGDRLRNHSVGGTQISMSTLGTVPNAANANHAISANNATNATNAATATTATNATSAGTAANASALGGQPPSAFEPAVDFIRTGLVEAVSGQTVPLAEFGPFALSLACVPGTGRAVEAEVQATSTEADSDGNGMQMTIAGLKYVVASTASSGTAPLESRNNVDFFTPSGATYVAELTVGQNFLGAACYANALVSTS